MTTYRGFDVTFNRETEEWNGRTADGWFAHDNSHVTLRAQIDEFHAENEELARQQVDYRTSNPTCVGCGSHELGHVCQL